MYSKNFSGVILALFAAIFNATVGVISVNLFSSGLSPQSIAFLKCLIAFIVVSTLLLASGKYKEVLPYLKNKWKAVAICAFFGFFMLYHFETAAYETINVPVVVFCLFGASTITTFILGAIFEKRFLNFRELISIIMSMLGLYFLFIDGGMQDKNLVGVFNAIMSGVGYGVFLVLSKRLEISSGLTTIFCLLFFGLIYLVFPFISSGSGSVSFQSFLYLLLLALLPTIGGFWATTKALTLLKSQSVQLIELTEPIFAIFFSFIFLAQLTTKFEIFGGILIVLTIVFYEFFPQKKTDIEGNAQEV
ncbi:DMT family transporter [Psychromonas sp. Urea-02u-13]|uniref:DMT family transporter n=1 Tax=Psychromonas sp. Urea-02u-13 TaxID=2058326 RepID=UPI000C349597|nr:DMT family transporter [Psychromonas sp. Urea-02u-13]PKG37194.1 EamA/RhaT family transporter [Psychromonas sp. Urea-02u-13]